MSKWLKRWKVTTRTNRGKYASRFYFTHRKAKRFADDYADRGLGAATVTRGSS
jgi:hypothetical protein